MNFTLVRTDFLPTGIFGKLISEDNQLILEVLEHSYTDAVSMPNPSYYAKVPLGVYTCVRGLHKLERMTKHFETFEIMNVPGHTGVLFHQGNINNDSNGCLLLGSVRDDNRGILGSQIAFERFMNTQYGIDGFLLEVR